MYLSFLLRFLRSNVLKAPTVKSTLITARSYCVLFFAEVGSIGPFTVHIIVVFPWDTRDDPAALGWTAV